MKRHTSFCFVLALLCLAGAAWSVEAPVTCAPAAPTATTLSAPALPWLNQAAPSAEAPKDLSPAPTPNFFSGYCTIDCSRCTSSLQCESRGAGTCTQIPLC